jgi:hypothetical protein
LQHGGLLTGIGPILLPQNAANGNYVVRTEQPWGNSSKALSTKDFSG